jgi:alkylation response protein AidB-like acyl-CoA dehydrogenase
MLTQTDNPARNEDKSLIAPDTSDWNFYEADHALQDLLGLYLAPDLLEHLKPHLAEMGRRVAGDLDQAAHLADRHPPILHNRDRFGRDLQSIEYHPAYRRLEEAAFGTFAMHAMSHRGGVLGWPEPFPAVAKHAFTYLFNQAEFGLGCPINVTDSGAHVLRLFADEDVKQRFLPNMLTDDVDVLWQGAQFMTEREGGSDVGQTATTARQVDGQWRIWGQKWFCSNADAGMALLLARPEGAPEGSRGLGLFAMPKTLDDGTRNAYRIVRLKDKLGTRSMASGEISLEGAVAYPVGPLENGLKQMLEMVNWSRLSNGIKSSALMRRAVHDATAVINGRKVFGSVIADKPLAKRQMLKIQLPAEQSLSLWMFAAEALDRAEGYGGQPPSQEAKAILRIATPVLKFRATRDGRRVTGDAMEMRGGIGYVEEWANPRLVRDAHLGSIWEGAGNVVAIDVVQRAIRRHACHEPFIAAVRAKLDEATDVPESHLAALRQALDKAGTLASQVAADPDAEIQSRHATTMLYHATTAALMAWEASEIHKRRGDARRLLWSKLILDHKLTPRDPFGQAATTHEDAIAACLMGDRPVAMAQVAALL